MPDTRLNPPSDVPESTGPLSDNPEKREVLPLFLTPKEERKASEMEPPGLNNPFWNR